jgi:hypothetical protein
MKLKSIIYIAPPFVIENIVLDKNGKKKKKYTGFMYEMWTTVKDKLLKNKIITDYEETILDKSVTLNDAYLLIKKGKYHIGIGNFSVVSSRNGVHFSRPLVLNKFALAYIPKEANHYIIFDIMIKKFLPTLLLGILISLILSGILYISPVKFKITDTWDLVTAILFMNGGKFFKIKNSFFYTALSFFILLIALFTGSYIQANITTALGSLKQRLYSNKITRESIKGKKVLVPHGYATNEVWVKYGAKIIKNKKGTTISDVYKKNTDKYFAFFEDYEILKFIKNENPDTKFIISNDNFGNDELGWPIGVSEKLNKLIFHINNEIVLLQDNYTIFNNCKKYFDKDAYLCLL